MNILDDFIYNLNKNPMFQRCSEAIFEQIWIGMVNETVDAKGTLWRTLKETSTLSEYVLDIRQEKNVGVYTTFSGSTIGNEMEALQPALSFSPEEHRFSQRTDIPSQEGSKTFRQNER